MIPYYFDDKVVCMARSQDGELWDLKYLKAAYTLDDPILDKRVTIEPDLTLKQLHDCISSIIRDDLMMKAVNELHEIDMAKEKLLTKIDSLANYG